MSIFCGLIREECNIFHSQSTVKTLESASQLPYRHMLKPFVYCHVNSVFMGFVGILEENKLTRYIKIQCVFANQLNICTRVKYLLTR